jgi:FtsH-binding integral membrane protein
MKKINPYFTIGTVGIIVTALLHIFLTIYIPGTALQITFIILYAVFIAFLAIGFWKILKEQKTT